MADGKIVFLTKIDNTQVEQDLKQLEKKIRQSEESISRNENAKLPLVNQAKELGAKLDAAKARAHMLREEMAAINNAMSPGSSPDDYAAASQNLPKVQEALKSQEKEVAALQKQWDGVNNKIDAYDIKIKAARDSIATNTEKAGKLAAQLNSGGSKMSGAFASAKAAAVRFEQRIISLGKRILVFSVIATAFRAIKNYMDKALKTNEEYTTQLSQLRAALATAFQPIYEFILPGLMAVMKVLTTIVMLVANVLSGLFGKTAAQSAQNAEALNKEADAIDNVGGAAKKASKSLANFDEINTLSSGESGGGAGGGGAASQYDFSEFDTAEYKAKLDELTVYLSGALLAIGAILAFSGANIGLGIALMAAGALGMAAVVKANWGAMSTELETAIAQVLFVLGGAALAIGAILTFSGAKPALGIGLMVAGAAALWGAAKLNWSACESLLKGPVGAIVGLISGALIAVGALLAFSGANPGLGIGLMAAGAVGLVASVTANWNSLVELLKGPIGLMVALIGGALLATGAILAFSGAAPALGIALMAAGAASLVTVAALNWEKIEETLEGPVGAVVAVISGALLALGAILAFSGTNIGLGIALMAAGSAGLVTVAKVNWDRIKNALQKRVGAVVAVISGALLVLGAVLAFSGTNIGLGIALMAAGAAGLVSVTAVNWNAVLTKLKGAWKNIRSWFKENVAPKLTLKYWTDKWDNVSSALKTSFKNGINAAITLFNQFITWINNKMNFSWEDKYLLGKKIISAGSIQLITIPQIPYLAQGAVLPPNKPFMAMVGDQKNGTNIEAPLATIQEALANVLAAQGTGDINITFTGDLAQLARVLKPVIDRENSRVGGSLAKGVF